MIVISVAWNDLLEMSRRNSLDGIHQTISNS
jgi:hypothetical protein